MYTFITSNQMIDFQPLFEFSCHNCVALCTFLVPMNLICTLATIVLTGLRRPQLQITQSVLLSSFFALIMIGHVLIWLSIGVIMLPTYILLCLGSTCLIINIWAIAHPKSSIRWWWDLLFHSSSPKGSEHHQESAY